MDDTLSILDLDNDGPGLFVRQTMGHEDGPERQGRNDFPKVKPAAVSPSRTKITRKMDGKGPGR